METSLQVYLQDHLAGAMFGVELVERCHRNNKHSEFAEALAELAGEIRSDRQALLAIMSVVGAGPSRLKVSVAWTFEKAHRLKPNGHPFSYTPLARLLELESLAVGIAGKKAMWRALEDLARERPIEGYDFAALAERAERQIRKVEALRLQAARTAFCQESSRRMKARGVSSKAE